GRSRWLRLRFSGRSGSCGKWITFFRFSEVGPVGLKFWRGVLLNHPLGRSDGSDFLNLVALHSGLEKREPMRSVRTRRLILPRKSSDSVSSSNISNSRG